MIEDPPVSTDAPSAARTQREVTCPHCHRMVRIPLRYVGERGRCKACGKIFLARATSPPDSSASQAQEAAPIELVPVEPDQGSSDAMSAAPANALDSSEHGKDSEAAEGPRPVRELLDRAGSHIERAVEKLYGETISRSSIRRSLDRAVEHTVNAVSSHNTALKRIDEDWRARYKRLEAVCDGMTDDLAASEQRRHAAETRLEQVESQRLTLENDLRQRSESQGPATERVAELELAIEELKSESARVTEAFQAERLALQGELQEKAGRLDASAARIGQLEQELAAHQERLGQASDQKDARQRELEARLEQVTFDLEKTLQSNRQLEQGNVELEANLRTESAAAIERLQQRIVELEQVPSHLTQQLDGLRSEHAQALESLRARLAAEHDAAAESLAARLKGAEERLERAASERKAYETQSRQLAAQAEQLAKTHLAEKAGLEKTAAQLKKALSAAESGHAHERLKLAGQAAQLGTRIDSFSDHLGHLAARLAGLERAAAESSASEREARTALAAAEQQLGGLREQQEAAAREVDSALTGWCEAEAAWQVERDSLLADKQAAQRQLAEAEASLNAARDQNDTSSTAHQQTLAQARAQIDAIASHLSTLGALAPRLHARIERLEPIIQASLEQGALAEVDQARAAAERDRLTQHLVSEQQAKHQTRARGRRLRALLHDRIEALRADLKRQTEEFAGREERLQQAVSEAEARQQTAAQTEKTFEQELERYRERLARAESELESTSAQKNDQARSIAELKERLREAEANLLNVRDQLAGEKASRQDWLATRARQERAAHETVKALSGRLAELEALVEQWNQTPEPATRGPASPAGPALQAQPAAPAEPVRLTVPLVDRPREPGPAPAALPASVDDYLSHALDHLLNDSSTAHEQRGGLSLQESTPPGEPAPPATPRSESANARRQAEIDKLRPQFLELFESRDFGRAAVIGIRILEQCQGLRPTDHQQIDTCFRDLAIAQMLSGELGEARANIQSALAHLEDLPNGSATPLYAMRLGDLAMILLRQGEPHESRKALEKAVSLANRILPATDAVRQQLEIGLAHVRKQCQPTLDPGFVMINSAGM